MNFIRWELLDKDGDWAQEAVLNTLKTLPKFRVLLSASPTARSHFASTSYLAFKIFPLGV
jgi:hypothetical protein